MSSTTRSEHGRPAPEIQAQAGSGSGGKRTEAPRRPDTCRRPHLSAACDLRMLRLPLCFSDRRQEEPLPLAAVTDVSPQSETRPSSRHDQYQKKYFAWLSAEYPGWFPAFREFLRGRAGQRFMDASGVLQRAPRFSGWAGGAARAERSEAAVR